MPSILRNAEETREQDSAELKLKRLYLWKLQWANCDVFFK